MNVSSSSALAFLSRRPRAETLEGPRSEILRLKRESDERTPEASAFAHLNQQRILCSSTLVGQGDDRSAWDAANHYLAADIQAGHPASVDRLLRLHALLTGSEEGFRKTPVYAGPFAYPDPSELSAARDIFAETILPEPDPLLRAALSYIWICVMHPFANGNGRTARMFADGILISEGFLPLCFPTPAAGHVVPGYAERDISLEEAIRRCWTGVLHSYRLLSMF